MRKFAQTEVELELGCATLVRNILALENSEIITAKKITVSLTGMV